MLKRIISLMLIALLICSMGLVSFASTLPDMSQKGSISINVDIGEIGGNFTLYRVGEISDDNGDLVYVPTGDFVDCGETYESVGAADLAKRLEKYAKAQKIDGETKAIDFSGHIAFEDLELGLYLVAHKELDGSEMKAAPFLVTVPQIEDGAYVYDIEASPKVQLVFVASDDDGDNPPGPDVPDVPDEPKLPQTGQLNWPVPVLTVAGLGLFALGFMLCSGKKKERNEK